MSTEREKNTLVVFDPDIERASRRPFFLIAGDVEGSLPPDVDGAVVERRAIRALDRLTARGPEEQA